MNTTDIITTKLELGLSALQDLAGAINREHAAAAAAANTAIGHALNAGRLLLQVKAQLAHGEFLPWLRSNCTVKQRQARAYMRVARNWRRIESKTAPGADLTVKGALRLLSKNRGPRPWRFPIHRFGRIMPWMTKPELNSLADSIRRHGLRHPITLYQGRILDGKCRYRACLLAGVAPSFTEFQGDDMAALAYVKSMNLMRASYSPDQLAVAYVCHEQMAAELGCEWGQER